MHADNGYGGKIRWGILGTGNIAKQFATALQSLPDAELAAVGSRTRDAAEGFARPFGIARRHASYAALAEDPDIDVIYVATPHALHRDNAILCLDAGKAVLCEKPFAINRSQAAEMIETAQRNRRFLMEAMWTRFIPAVRQTRRWIDEGAIGEVRMVQASFGFRDNDVKLFDPALGGGSLLDVGVYPITLAHLAFGASPAHIESIAWRGRGGVDEQAGILLGHEGGGIAVLASAVQTQTPYDAHILGTAGMIRLHDPFWSATRVTLQPAEGLPTTLNFPHACNGYEYEAIEVQTCLRAARLDSDTMPHRTSLEIMGTLDAIRAQWGLRYPME